MDEKARRFSSLILAGFFYVAEEGSFETYSFSTPIGSLVREDTPSSAQSGFKSLTEAPRASSYAQKIPERDFILCVGRDLNPRSP